MSSTMYFPNLKKDGERPIATGTKVNVSGEDKAAMDVYVVNPVGAAVNVSSGPIQFTKNAATVTVTEDTVTPSNNVPLPVKLTGVTGDINITAGDLNVQTSHSGVNYDSTRIGDGTDLLQINNDGSINSVVSGSVSVSNFPATQPISAASLPLPTGAATEATLSTLNGKVPANLTVSATRLLVDGSGVTQPVSAASLPLPTGAATSANQVTTNNSLSSIDGKMTTTVNGLKVDGSAVTQPVSAASLPLPTGAATSANQTTANASLASIDSKTPSLGQALMAASQPVVIASNQSAVPVSASSLPLPTGAATEATLSTLNGKIPSNLTVTSTRLLVDGSGVTQPVSGSVTANIGTTNGLALDTSVTGLQVAQGSTTSGQSGPLMQAAVLSSNPTYTNGQTSPLSMATNGSLRVTMGVSAANGASLPTNVAVVGGYDGTNVRAVKTDSTGQVYVTGTVSATSTPTYLSVVDLLDTPLLDASSTNIPGSASNSLQVVASLAAQVRKVQVLDTTGGFYGVYSGAVSSPTLLFVVGPGSDQTIEMNISAGTLISLRSLTASAITSGNVAINFIG